MHQFQFTFKKLTEHYKNIKDAGYTFITCEEYVHLKKTKLPFKTVVNRVDIDFSVKKTENLVRLFNDLGIKATFFLRLHAPEYNPFSFESYRIIKFLIESGHELGYHSEIVDQAAIWDESAEVCLKRDIDTINRIFNTQIKGIASHGGTTGLNNLDFWKNRKANDFGLLYEAYDYEPSFNLFQECFYISDSEWIRWKCYDKGKRVADDYRTPTEHLEDNHPLIGLLIHPDTYYFEHIYE
jgi:hypothetical protein